MMYANENKLGHDRLAVSQGIPVLRLDAHARFAWVTASVAWSPTPDVSLGKVRTDLLLPLTA